MQSYTTDVFYTPENDELRYLPEGPYRWGKSGLSWVAIQHGRDQRVGSLNLLDVHAGTNRTIQLEGRPGFAFPTTDPSRFVVGLERSVILLNLNTGGTETLADGVDAKVDGTIINDGLVVGDHLVFGCKDLKFEDKKAGLYIMRPGGELVTLANDQLCSNGKAVRVEEDGTFTLFDIDTPSQQVKQWKIDFDAGKMSNPITVVDLTEEAVYPDGMILTPDQKSVIVAIFNPGDASIGEARQYGIASGALEAVWTCSGSARVTCPQLIRYHDKVKLLLTTADEDMEPAVRDKNPNAGCLFVGDTSFDSLNDNPTFPI